MLESSKLYRKRKSKVRWRGGHVCQGGSDFKWNIQGEPER